MRATILSDNLRKLRVMKGLSQSRMSECLEIDLKRYAKYEEARNEPKLELMIRIANYHGVTVEQIYTNPI